MTRPVLQLSIGGAFEGKDASLVKYQGDEQSANYACKSEPAMKNRLAQAIFGHQGWPSRDLSSQMKSPMISRFLQGTHLLGE